MNFEELQQNWQTHATPSLKVDQTTLYQIVCRSQQDFTSLIWCRDTREIVIALILVCFLMFIYSITKHVAFLLFSCGGIFTSLFFILDRFIQAKRAEHFENDIVSCLHKALYQIDHQIWLLRHVFWWYLLPSIISMTGGMLIFFGSIDFNMGLFWRFVLPIGAFFMVTCLSVYRLNQRAVKQELLPRRQEVINMLESLCPSEFPPQSVRERRSDNNTWFLM